MALSPTNALNELAYALGANASRLVIDKASIANAVVGAFQSLWRATGQPGQGAIPTAAAVCAHGLAGSFGFTQQTAPLTSYIGYLEAVCQNNSVSLEIHDRLMHEGGMNGTLTTAQTSGVNLNGVTASNMVERVGDANFSDVQWWLEWYADTGATAANATVNVTYNDGTTGNLNAVAVGGTVRASRMIGLNGLIPAGVAGKFIRAVNTVTLSASTATAGNFGVVATRKRVSLTCPVANLQWGADWAELPLSEAFNDSCLFLVMIAGATTTGTVRGGGKIGHI